MTLPKKDAAPEHDRERKEISTDEQTDTKIHQHLADINDQISEQDIKNVRTDFNETVVKGLEENDVAAETVIDQEEHEPAKDKKDEDGEKEAIPIITPWNILGS